MMTGMKGNIGHKSTMQPEKKIRMLEKVSMKPPIIVMIIEARTTARAVSQAPVMSQIKPNK